MSLQRLHLNQSSRPMGTISYWKRTGDLLLDAPYQRGDVWGPVRQRNLIKSFLTGVPVPAIIINDRFAADWGTAYAIIDGRQRCTAILAFVEGRLAVPGEWFDLQGEVTFEGLPVATQRRFRNLPILTCEGALPSLEAEQELFELINFGGVPQGQSDL